MKAVRINQFGDLDVLKYGDYPEPELSDGDVFVKVMATAVSGWDIKYRRGDVMNQKLPGRTAFPLPQQLGRECAGIVMKTGKQVRCFSPGDHVLGLVHPENTVSENAFSGLLYPASLFLNLVKCFRMFPGELTIKLLKFC